MPMGFSLVLNSDRDVLLQLFVCLQQVAAAVAQLVVRKISDLRCRTLSVGLVPGSRFKSSASKPIGLCRKKYRNI